MGIEAQSGESGNRSGPVPPTDGPPTWTELPEVVRSAVVDLAARALISIDPRALPPQLAKISAFTARKRSNASARVISRLLEGDGQFRAQVAATVVSLAPTDPVLAAARGFLLQLDTARDALAELARQAEAEGWQQRALAMQATIETLAARLASAEAPGQVAAEAPGGGKAAGAGGGGPAPDPASEALARAEKLQARLRAQGVRLREVQTAADEQVAAATAARDVALAELAATQSLADRLRLRVDQEEKRAQSLQRALDRQQAIGMRARADSDRRIALLLETVRGAADGLATEWRLVSGGADPADALAGRWAALPVGVREADAEVLLQWLRLPQAHLIVDGYNVTKSGYPDLSLALQRDRLIQSLSGLAARTDADVTAVFDGSSVVAPPAGTRRTRVVFSPEGVLADDVIRDLGMVEPVGRVVVVVSSDKEVVRSVRRAGARTAPATVLLDVLQ